MVQGLVLVVSGYPQPYDVVVVYVPVLEVAQTECRLVMAYRVQKPPTTGGGLSRHGNGVGLGKFGCDIGG